MVKSLRESLLHTGPLLDNTGANGEGLIRTVTEPGEETQLFKVAVTL